jgi:hypothetical protein
MAPVSSSNAAEKEALWKKITQDVNSVSVIPRETPQIRKKWSDWVYTTKKKKKTLSGKDQELVDFLSSVHDDPPATESTSQSEASAEHLADNTATQSADRNDGDERTLITSLIQKHYGVLFGSFTNTITHDLKCKLWREITQTINETCGDIAM